MDKELLLNHSTAEKNNTNLEYIPWKSKVQEQRKKAMKRKWDQLKHKAKMTHFDNFKETLNRILE